MRLASQNRAARGPSVVAAEKILVVLLGALSTFSYVTLSGYLLVLLGFMALGRDPPRWGQQADRRGW